MKFEINATKRTLTGSGASRRLRRADKVPGIVYGGTQAPEMIEMAHNEILLALRKEAFHSSVLSLKLDGKAQQVLLRDTQMHAYKPRVLHIDFLRVAAGQTIHVKIPLHFINEDIAPGVKLHNGLVTHVMTEVEVSCLPKDLPQFIEVDLSALDIGESIHVQELKMPKGVSAVIHGGEHDHVVASLTAKKGGSVDDEAVASDAAAAEGEAKPEAGKGD